MFLALAPLLALSACQDLGAPAAPTVSQGVAASPRASGERLSEISRVLASDEFQGRSMGTIGEEKTIAYLVEQFQAAGLEPGGENGSWIQSVPLIRTQLEGPVAVSIRQSGETVPLAFPDDIYLGTAHPAELARIADAPMVFVGYGVNALERDWDDFKGLDLEGKVAVFLMNDPDFEASTGEPVAGRFGGETMTYYGRWTYKFEEAARRGAIAALVVHETQAAGYGWNVVKSHGGESFSIVLPTDAPQPLRLQGWIQRPVAEALLKRAGLDFETVKREARTTAFKPIDLKATFRANAAVDIARITSRNVIGKLTGSSYPRETVSYAVHWDALGIGPPDDQGRTIRPGAADDALGTAAMIDIARMFSSGARPGRTLLFFAWTSEERNLLGSEYYAQNPIYPHETMVANLTLDTLQWAGPVRDVVLIGKGQSSMEELLAEAAAAQGRYVTPEGHPERGLFYRADHFTFAKRGVPVLLNMALAGAHDLVDGGREAGERWLDEFTAHCYHQPCDAWAADWDVRGAAQEAELFHAIGARLANSREWPQWYPDSEFANERQKSAAARQGARPAGAPGEPGGR